MAEEIPRRRLQPPSRQNHSKISPCPVPLTPQTASKEIPTSLRQLACQRTLLFDNHSQDDPFEKSTERSPDKPPKNVKIETFDSKRHMRSSSKAEVAAQDVSARNTKKKEVEESKIDDKQSVMEKTLKSDESRKRKKTKDDAALFAPVTPAKKGEEVEEKVFTRAIGEMESKRKRRDCVEKKRRVYYKKVVYDGGEFEVGDDVYVKRREDASSDDEDPETEECRICFRAGRWIMIECDDCLGGFHLKRLQPPLRGVPDGDWICKFCEARKSGKEVEFLEPPKGKKWMRLQGRSFFQVIFGPPE